jgi:hypothetical protein
MAGWFSMFCGDSLANIPREGVWMSMNRQIIKEWHRLEQPLTEPLFNLSPWIPDLRL